MNTQLSKVVIDRNCERKLITGYQWIFSSEISKKDESVITGDIVEVLSNSHQSLGWGVYNAHSQIAVRMLSKEPIASIEKLFVERIKEADKLRKQVLDRDTYRVVYGESDFLPGLIIDRYDDIIVVESLAAWVDLRMDILIPILVEYFHPTSIIERSESVWREREGLVNVKRPLYGEKTTTTIELHQTKYIIEGLDSQKTGFFLDQSENHFAIRNYARGKKILDCFCNAGGFALNAAKAGALSVIGIDSSANAIANAERNADLNGLAEICSWIKGDVMDVLASENFQSEKFDCVILDPPAFVKSKSKLHSGIRGYMKLNQLGMRHVHRGGILVSCTCSHHVNEELFLQMLLQASVKSDRYLRILEVRSASIDHPVLAAMPETKYLTVAICRID